VRTGRSTTPLNKSQPKDSSKYSKYSSVMPKENTPVPERESIIPQSNYQSRTSNIFGRGSTAGYNSTRIEQGG
jgi:hypothetical protein